MYQGGKSLSFHSIIWRLRAWQICASFTGTHCEQARSFCTHLENQAPSGALPSPRTLSTHLKLGCCSSGLQPSVKEQERTVVTVHFSSQSISENLITCSHLIVQGTGNAAKQGSHVPYIPILITVKINFMDSQPSQPQYET